MTRLLLLCVALLCVAPAAHAATLSATTSTFPTVFASAQPGDVIELASGSYGQFDGDALTSPGVTIRPASGATASIRPNFYGAANITLDGLVITGLLFADGTHDITVKNSEFTGLAVVGSINGAPFLNADIVFDNNTFDGIDTCGSCYEGRLTIKGSGTTQSSPMGVTITDNHFGDGGESDGVQVTGQATGVQIGPGNEFEGILQGSFTAHVDSIQLYGSSQTEIVGNYFHNNDVVIMAPDGGDRELIANNVMVGASYRPSVQLGSHTETQFVHNTVVDIDVHADAKSGEPNSEDVVVKDNVFVNGTTNATGSLCTTCTVSYNLFSVSGDATGTNTVSCTPVFAGGSSITSHDGAVLSSSSPCGYLAGSDSTSMGVALLDHQPTASFTASTSPSTVNQSVTFDASASSCIDAPCTYTWEDDGNDGPGGTQTSLGSGQTLTKTFTAAGTVHVRLKVTDADGDLAQLQQDHTVNAASPTFISENETSWDSAAASKSVTYAVQAGDVLVAYGMTENSGITMSISGGVTWTQRQAVTTTGYARAYAWTGTAASAGTLTTTCTRTAGSGGYGCDVYVFRGASGIGASASTHVSSGAPSLAITTQAAGSAIVVANTDWNAAQAPSRTWRSGAGAFTEKTYDWTLNGYTVFGGYHANAGAAGAKTVGLSAPSGQKYSIVAVEVKA
jgi:hypothetical protein